MTIPSFSPLSPLTETGSVTEGTQGLPEGAGSRAQEETIRINTLDSRGSVCDGPGLRTVLFIQGCSRGCLGCHNTAARDPLAGRTVAVRELAKLIRATALTRRLTVSGGEPLEQTASLIALLDELSDLDVALYTGYDLAEVPRSVLVRVQWIKVGSFDLQRRIGALT